MKKKVVVREEDGQWLLVWEGADTELETDDHETKNPESFAHVTWADVVKSGRSSNE